MSERHCPTCICGRRAPVQGDYNGRGPGSISWAEHLLAHAGYVSRYGSQQTAERVAERGGFSYGELVEFLGREPTSWTPRKAHQQTA